MTSGFQTSFYKKNTSPILGMIPMSKIPKLPNLCLYISKDSFRENILTSIFIIILQKITYTVLLYYNMYDVVVVLFARKLLFIPLFRNKLAQVAQVGPV